MDSAQILLSEIQDRLDRLVSDGEAALATVIVTFKNGSQVELNSDASTSQRRDAA